MTLGTILLIVLILLLIGALPSWGEDEDGAKILGECLGGESRPMTLNLGGKMVAEVVRVDLFQRNWPFFVPNEHGLAAEANEPFHHVLRIRDAAT